MKLTSIRLTNVRRFVDPVEITGIAPGLNLLSAPNEQGKSTIFDALHALFFHDAKSWKKEVSALAPYAGGDPEIEVTLTHEGHSYRIAKIFTKASGKGSVRIWRDSALLHQADAAEAWLRDLISPPKDGPVGMLWVRQGLTDFSDAKETLDARRDLMSSLSGEIETVTGGQQMEVLRRRLRAELDRLVTSRGARKGGPLAEVETRVANLTERRDTLAAQVADLRQLLDQRQTLRREQSELTAPEAAEARQSRLRAAETALAAAERHQEQREQAGRALDLAVSRRDAQAARGETLAARLADHTRAATARTQATDLRVQAQQRASQAATGLATAQSGAATARSAVTVARAAVAKSLRAEAAQHAAGLRREQQARLAQVDTLLAAIEVDRQQAGLGPDAVALARMDQLAQAVALARHSRAAAAAALSVTYEAGPDAPPALLLDGAPLPQGAQVALPDGGTLEVPGLAQVTIHPARTQDADALPKAETALATALSDLGYECLEAAQAAHQSRSAAAARVQEAEATLTALAPKGRGALVQALGALPKQPDPEEADSNTAETTPDRVALEHALSAAEEQQTTAEALLEQARAEDGEARQITHAARATEEAAIAQLAQIEQALGDLAVARAQLDQLQAAQPALDAAVITAREADARLAADAPDLDQIRASCQRARTVLEAAQARAQDIARDLAVLEARISTHASHAVEEDLSEVTDQLSVAEAAHDALLFEVATLSRLDQALEAAQAGAQAQYLGPLMAELTPLLRRLWPEAALQLDADSVLPSQLARGAAEEQLTQLSGGTQEQLALMVRLAFARLLAKSGRGIPVILDDALAYTDDARIEALFDALTLQANDLQILVFSCRQKSFRDLGGTSLTIRPAQGIA
ncbi:AAA family ATPase [Phaeobacter porticola]|uniref:AAA domain protein n=1 Tax=Phaeobacter porticola TaxID=1844006 RepID=A0A1L3I1V6_9RHOB|nr:AAA family ATPase [Phaeobacter porticola]APG46113.1 AAA domain protein [Phaeobacter porticola]